MSNVVIFRSSLNDYPMSFYYREKMYDIDKIIRATIEIRETVPYRETWEVKCKDQTFIISINHKLDTIKITEV